MGRSLPTVPVIPESIQFNGGLDVVTPPLKLPSSFAREAQNFEQDINGGYARIVGYERYSGLARPSDATYAILPMTTVGTYATDGSVTVTGATSGATGVVVGSDATNKYLVITKTTGTFVAENLTAGGGVVSGAAVIDGASTPKLHAQYNAAAANVYRALIAAVPGSGKILGVWLFNDVRYALRNNLGGTAAAMYKSTVAGWSLVALGEEISFSNATTTAIEGATLTQGGVTATITRVVLQTGSLASGTNTGRFIFATHAGGNFAAGAATAGAGAVTLGGAQTAITFAVPGGRFEFVNYNFGGSANTTRMYGCDGKNRSFEFDGTVFVPIATGMSSDAPEHISAHKNRLFLSFKGSVQFSTAGFPYQWSVIVGAGELAMGDTVAGFMPQPSGANETAFAVFTQRNMAVLYGTSSSTFNLNPFDQHAGAYAYTMQYVGLTLLLNDRGLNSLQTTQKYGNFASATLSARVQPWLRSRRALVTASCVMRDKNQYRLFFSDGYALFVTHNNGAIVGAMPILFPIPVRCACSEQMSDGTEVVLFGSDDGYVYEMERGTSFDGASIEFFLSLAYNHSGTPRQEKRYRSCEFEITGDGYFEFDASYALGYGSTDIEQPGSTTVANELSSTLWDDFVWDSFYWDGATLLPSRMDLDGTAQNLSLIIRGNADYMQPARISGATIQYSHRRNLR